MNPIKRWFAAPRALLLALGLTVLFAPSLFSAENPSPAEDMARIRERWAGTLTNPDPMDAASVAALKRLDDTAEEFARTQNADGSWGDAAQSDAKILEGVSDAFGGKVRRLSRSWATPSAKRYHDPETLERIVRALRFYLPLAKRGGIERPGNWWLWDIGTPMNMGDCLLLVADAIPPELRTESYATLTTLLRLDGPDPETGDVLGHKFRGRNAPGPLSGENAIWIDMARMRLALLTGDDKLMHASVDDLTKVFSHLETKPYYQGIPPDWSYLIHGPQLMWSYGSGQVQDSGMATMLLAGTRYALPTKAVAFQENLLLEGARWCTTHFRYHPMTIGRGVAHGGASRANYFLAGAVYLGLADGPRHLECAALAKRWLADAEVGEDGGIPDYLLKPVKCLREMPGIEPAAPLDGCRAFVYGDYLAIQRPGWGAGVKMFSNRTWPYEIVNGEGLRSHHNSDGTLFLITKPTDWPADVWPALDWDHLPGATICPTQVTQPWQKVGETAFVGATTMGRNAVAAQDLKTQELRARKSWMVLGDVIVCLGSGIIGPEPTDTTLAQTPITKADADFVLDGKPVAEAGDSLQPRALRPGARWAVVGNSGYVLLDAPASISEKKKGSESVSAPVPLIAQRVTRTGNRKAIIANQDVPMPPVTYGELILPHGAPTATTPGSYAYAILPVATVETVSAWAQFPPVSILANSEKLHAARDTASGMSAAVFWEPGEVGGLTVDAPCIAIWSGGKGAKDPVNLTMADPTQETRSIRVRWAGRGEKSVEVKDGLPTTVTF